MFSSTGLNHISLDDPIGLFSLNCNSHALLTIIVLHSPLTWSDRLLFTERPSCLALFRIHSEVINLIGGKSHWTGVHLSEGYLH
jgi:hypothetical protein